METFIAVQIFLVNYELISVVKTLFNNKRRLCYVLVLLGSFQIGSNFYSVLLNVSQKCNVQNFFILGPSVFLDGM